ncbi:hypothetical protein C1645_840483 [Glomus cerebriforme]|uniref:Uncharacterized protein n=1 Tax=Glomus cerebriforme TaxID=658196 RepID=A0A397S5E0_9GLOM|nr:hypothetical protein C1645_840483 [Glomus cerebriforme]
MEKDVVMKKEVVKEEDEMNIDQHKSHHGKKGKCEKTNIEYSAPITIIDDSSSIQEVERDFD